MTIDYYKREKMSRYTNGKIYELVNTVDDEIYIGSTCLELCKRLSAHKSMARKSLTRRVYTELNIIGWENCRIMLIEAYPCTDKQELIAREQYVIDLLKPSLNTNASRGELPEWKKQHYLGEEAYLVNDALLSFVVSRRKDGTTEYSFESTV